MPYARMTTFSIKAGNHERVQQLLDTALEAMKKMAGFQSVTAFHDDSYQTAGAFSIWDSRADAEGVTPGVRDIVLQQAREIIAAPPQTQIYVVYSEPVQTFPIGRP